LCKAGSLVECGNNARLRRIRIGRLGCVCEVTKDKGKLRGNQI